MIRSWKAALFAAALPAGAFAQAGPTVPTTTQSASSVTLNQTLQTYEVSGDTADAVRADMSRKRPTSRSGERFDASAEWKVTWRAEYTTLGAGCRVRKSSVTVNVTVTAPSLAASAPGDVRLRFDRYYANLMVHENDHVENGVEVGREIASGLVLLPPEATCDALDEVIQIFANAAVAKGNARDLAIDQTTRYGATQGAVFP